MTTTASLPTKKVEGLIEDLLPAANPTNIVVGKKTIYIPSDKRERIKSLNLAVGKNAEVTYDTKGNLVDIKLREPEKEGSIKQPEPVQPVVIGAGDQPVKQDVYIQSPKVTEKIREITSDKQGTLTGTLPDYQRVTPPMHQQEDMHIHSSKSREVSKKWMSETEKEDRITFQSVLARAVEIVDAHYSDYKPKLKDHVMDPELGFKEGLEDRLKHIEAVADRLFKYSKKRVEAEQEKEHEV